MFSDLATVRAALKERIETELPTGWEVSPFIRQPPTEYRNPLVIFEFTRFDGTANGAPLSPGQVGAGIDIVVGSPKTAEGSGEDDVDQLALALVQVIEAESDIYFDYAEKQRLTTSGQWVWRIHTIVITSTKE